MSFGWDCSPSSDSPMILSPFGVVASKLKQKYHNAVRVWLVNNKLQERVNNQFRPVSSKDQKLVYLDSSPDYCVRNDAVGSRGMLGRSCKSAVTTDKCKRLIDLCNSCNLRVETVEYIKQVVCNCFCVVYLLRVNLSIALVAMVNSTYANAKASAHDPECQRNTSNTSPEKIGEFKWDQQTQGKKIY
ncbi:hypothetical protein ACROYT_G031930 [Oculina patagonica]